MSVYTNITKLETVRSLRDLWDFADIASGSIMSGTFILAIFFVLFISLMQKGTENALIASSFSCFILGSYLSFAGVLNVMFPLLFLLMCGGTLLYSITVGSKK